MGNIGDLIVEKRKERGLTQTELGSMLGISGKYSLTFTAVSRITHDYVTG